MPPSATSAESNGQRPGTKSDTEMIYRVAFTRLICAVVWTCGILYSTYQLIITAEEFLPWQRDPVMNPGPLAQILGRGRDSTDPEWTNFTYLFLTKLIYWYLGYVVLSLVIPGKFQTGLSLVLSFLLSKSVLGFIPTLYIFLQPVLYWSLVQAGANKRIIWSVSFGLFYLLNVAVFKEAFGFNRTAEYFFDICLGWTYSRCLSFTFDRWQRKDNNSISALYKVISYCFYFPLLFHGPLILYNRYEADILQGGKEKNPDWRNGKTLLKRSCKILALALLTEVIIHYIYFKPLSLTLPLLNHVNLWCLCGVIYWLGQFFMLKYQVMYGSSTCIAQFDGVEMPPLPKCPAHIHRYSVLWKDFDRGLYNFLVQYTYIPIIKALNEYEQGKALPVWLKKIIASLFTFFYVFAWHGVWFPIFLWSFLNFLGITIEQAGSFVKRQLQAQPTFSHFSELFWDAVVEPIVTIPLAVMSILNSVIFTGSMEAAIICTRRLLWTDVNRVIFLFLYCFIHVGVTVRTWSTFKFRLKNHS